MAVMGYVPIPSILPPFMDVAVPLNDWDTDEFKTVVDIYEAAPMDVCETTDIIFNGSSFDV